MIETTQEPTRIVLKKSVQQNIIVPLGPGAVFREGPLSVRLSRVHV
jgi:hypothetical protein